MNASFLRRGWHLVDDGPLQQHAIARAAWHLELGYEPGDDLPAPVREPDNDEEFDDSGTYPGGCWNCSNGWVILCCDDLCHGQDFCMHGSDGMAQCHVCNQFGEY